MRSTSFLRLPLVPLVALLVGSGLATPPVGDALARPDRAVRAPASPRIKVTAVRAYTAPDHTRIVVDLRGGAPAVRPRTDTVDGAPAIVLDLPGTGGQAPDLTVRDSLVETVRLSTTGEGSALAVRLTQTARYEQFTLRAADGRPDRIVLDVKREIAPVVRAREDSLYAALKARQTRIIAVDAGHGGEDSGAVGPSGVSEKDVCLAIAQALATRIDALPGFHAVLTRRGDYFVPLRERTRIARRAKADVFLSIHANASRSRQAYGTEVFFLSPHGATDEIARATAQRENEADLVGGLPARADDEVAGILLDLAQTATLERSGLLAEAALDQLATAPSITSRGVKQAGFVVLKTVDVPSILVETAFISNPREQRQLTSAGFQGAIADRLTAAIAGYFSRYPEE